MTRLLITCLCLLIAHTSLALDRPKPVKEKLAGEQLPLFPIELPEPFPKAEKTFDEVKSFLLKYYYSNKLNEDALYHAAIEGMLRHVSPPQNRELAKLWSPTEFQAFADALKGVQSSIGIHIQHNKSEGSLLITHVIPGSPADGKLMPGDRIMRINGKPFKNLPAQTINDMLQGEVGSQVHFKVVRDIEVLDISLARQLFSLKNLDTRIHGKLAYMIIKSVSKNIAEEVSNTLHHLEQEGVEKLIIDMRNNTGGDFFEGIAMAETLLPANSIVLRTLQKDQGIENYVSRTGKPPAFETILLVNQNTASSAEIFSAALRDHQRARIVGTRTHGKATVEGTYSLKNGYYTKFIIAAMYSPRGQSWHGSGLLPDFYVETNPALLEYLRSLPIEAQLKSDLQLATAWKLLAD